MKSTLKFATCLVLVSSTMLWLPTVHSQPVTSSNLYYKMGGGTPFSGASNSGSLSAKLGGAVRTNYSCGKFDIGVSWSSVMNDIQSLGTTLTNAMQAGISSLPLYALQRAQPGLYQLFQNLSQKADFQVDAALKSCEQMEAMIAQGKDPYEDWVALAKGDAWKIRATASGDVVQAKTDINKNESAQKAGIPWVFGTRAGGSGTDPIQPVRDLAVAGYNLTINRPATSTSTANYGSSSLAATRLVSAFKTPESLATWSSEVLGDQKIYLCSTDSGCPTPTSTVTATGLGPKYEGEFEKILPILQGQAQSRRVNQTELASVSAPGMAVTPQLMEAVQKLAPDVRNVAVNRLSQELAMHKAIDKALIARNALIAGMSVPEATSAAPVSQTLQAKVDLLTQYINDLMFEFRIRKEMTGETALAIMSNQFSVSSGSAEVSPGVSPDPNPLVDGRVKTP